MYFCPFCHLKTASQVKNMTIEELEAKFREFLGLRSEISKTVKRKKNTSDSTDRWGSMCFLDSVPEENLSAPVQVFRKM
jgi:hypothetical protein